MIAKHYQLTYKPYGKEVEQTLPTFGKTDTKILALNLIKDGHSNVTAHSLVDGVMFPDATLNAEISQAHQKRMGRDLTAYAALRKLVATASTFANIVKSEDLSDQQKAELMQAFLEVLPTMGIDLPLIMARLPENAKEVTEMLQNLPNTDQTGDKEVTDFDPFLTDLDPQTDQVNIAEYAPGVDESKEQTVEVSSPESHGKRTRSFLNR